VVAAIVEGCGRTEPILDLADGESPDVTAPDGSLRDVRAPDGAIARDGEGIDGTVLPDAIANGPDARPDAPDGGPGATDARLDAPVTDVGVQTDGMRCSPLTSCNGTCINTNTDPMNCGTCGNTCSATTPTCLGGACVQTCATDSGPVLTNCTNAC